MRHCAIAEHVTVLQACPVKLIVKSRHFAYTACLLKPLFMYRIRRITTMKVPLLDLKGQYQSIKDEMTPVLNDVIESQLFILGPNVEKIEAEIARYCGAPYAVGVTSGSDALLLALMAMDIQPGDKVITTPYTFFATAGSICRVGAVPLFVDIAPDTFNYRSRQRSGRFLSACPRRALAREGHYAGASIRPVRRYARNYGDCPAVRSQSY